MLSGKLHSRIFLPLNQKKEIQRDNRHKATSIGESNKQQATSNKHGRRGTKTTAAAAKRPVLRQCKNTP